MERHSTSDALKPVNLDFDARVPIPFSVFPSSYRNEDAAVDSKETQIKVEGEVDLPQKARRTREDTEARYRYDIQADRRPNQDRTDFRRETRVYEERDRFDDRRRREDVDVDVDINVDRDRYAFPYELGIMFQAHTVHSYQRARFDDRRREDIDVNVDIDVEQDR